VSSVGSRQPSGQVRTELPAREPGGATPQIAISAGREVELGARSMLLLAEGLFRLDVVPQEDMVQVIVRSLAAEPHAELRSTGEVGGESRTLGRRDEVEQRSTGRFGGEIVLIAEDGAERPVAKILVGSVCHLERGLSSFTAQATVPNGGRA
jgi:hypothetical protein